jgi:hypothetical protein
MNIDEQMLASAPDLVKVIGGMTFSFDERSKIHVQNIAKHEFDKLKASKRLMRQYEKRQAFDEAQEEAQRIAEAERKAKQTVIAGTADKFKILGSFVRTEMQMASAGNDADIGHLDDERNEQQIELASALHLNQSSSKPRAGNKRKGGGGANTQPHQKTSKKAPVTVNGKSWKVQVKPADNGKKNKGKNPKQKKKKGKGKDKAMQKGRQGGTTQRGWKARADA